MWNQTGEGGEEVADVDAEVGPHHASLQLLGHEQGQRQAEVPGRGDDDVLEGAEPKRAQQSVAQRQVGGGEAVELGLGGAEGVDGGGRPGLGVGLVRRETPTEIVGVLAGAVDLDQHGLLVCGEEGAPVVVVPLAVHVTVQEWQLQLVQLTEY